MNQRRIRIGHKPSNNPIPKRDVSSEKYMSFGFQYFEQYEYFGLKDKKNSYFIALLEKLKLLSRLTIFQFQTDSYLRKAHRIHSVDWQAKNIPIKQKDLKIPDDEDIEIICFKINSGGGRCAGFFDINNIFQIILCDPKHNLQPSKDFDYKVDETESEKTCFSYAHSYLLEIKDFECSNEQCVTYKIQEKYTFDDYPYLYKINPDIAFEVQDLKNQGLIECVSDIFEYGMIYLNENKK